MKTIVKMAFLLVGALMFGTGCIEVTNTIKVNKNGSGTIEVKQIMSAETLKKMEAQGQKIDAMKAQMTNRQQFEKVGKIFGPHVKLETVDFVENKDGSKGAKATFVFKDISKVTFKQTPLGDNDGGGGEEKDDDISYSFKLEKKGDSSVLSIIPTLPTEKAKKPSHEELEQSMQMMQMMKGLKLRQVVKVDGKIIKTNASKVSKKKNSILLMMMDMDKLVADQETFKKVMGNPGDYEMLSKLKPKGFSVENPKRTTKIEFK